MALTVVDVYSVRFGTKIPLPKSVQDNIGRLRITPVAYKPIRTFTKHNGYNKFKHNNSIQSPDNWREKALVDIVRRVKEREDPEYSDIFSIFNKLTTTSLDKLSHDAITLIQKRDEQFRLRVTTLLFDKAIVQGSYSKVMAECAMRLNSVIPEIAEDLQTQIAMFPKLYDMADTITYPDINEAGYDDKVVAWMSQKNKRRGYARFMMELYSHGLIPEETVKYAFEQVIRELKETAKQTSNEQTIENTGQFVEFIFECSKTVAGALKEYLKLAVGDLLKVPKNELPSLNMRSKFKIEDALKLLEKKD